MKIGVNVPNFGPGTDPGALRAWAQTVEGLGYDLLMVSDHVAITPDVAGQYPAPFYEPFTTLSWLAGVTERVRLGTTVLVVPYRHPLLVARMAANLDALSGGRLVLGAGIGWAKQEFDALGVPFEQRGKLTTEYLRTIRAAWADQDDYRAGPIPLWLGGHSDAGLRRALELGDAWHPLRMTMTGFRDTLGRLEKLAGDRPVPTFAPRILLRITGTPLTGPDRRAGEGTLDQVLDDLAQLRGMGAETVVLDPFDSDPAETLHPEAAWRDLAAVAASWKENR
ncbi:LLM class flavin-dependent oxidoreductase [Amycolatopsis sp. NPDC051758]|uniref:LLM class flavin-dependent oxidoreductase n=1 Tax=Amycolatopsis sp. NPDC051758 TaxID=3363935 RepID=UPI00379328F0